MANTLTLEEFNTGKIKAMRKIYDKILEYYTARITGLECKSDTAKELLLYAKVLDSWEQDTYNYINFTNYTSNTNIQYIFKRINQVV